MIKKNIKLDNEEQAIEDSFDAFLQGGSLDAAALIEAAKNTGKKVSKPVSLRLTESDFTKAHAKALEEGVAYQTLLTSVIHLYLSGMLVRKS
ncbi:antitoxin [Piscirickettsia salmonis]|uniref:antitoxin n=1 Tax=Piscirickettsia salmonis TaxID=1238 RepID=UPI001662535C|nr:antitoxin [Piscirickettsia salmonis]QNR80110.1 antitoxin [Piscirickettsia salmonis]